VGDGEVVSAPPRAELVEELDRYLAIL